MPQLCELVYEGTDVERPPPEVGAWLDAATPLSRRDVILRTGKDHFVPAHFRDFVTAVHFTDDFLQRRWNTLPGSLVAVCPRLRTVVTNTLAPNERDSELGNAFRELGIAFQVRTLKRAQLLS